MTRSRTTLQPRSRRLLAGTALTGVLLPLTVGIPTVPALAHDDAEFGASVADVWGDCQILPAINEDHRHNDIAMIDSTMDGRRIAGTGLAMQQQATAGSRTEWGGSTVDGATGDSCRGNGAFDNVLTVGAGDSGLETGDPVTLVADVDLSLTADDHGSSTDPHITSWQVNAGYTVTDSGGATVAKLIAAAERTVDGYINPYTGAGSWTYEGGWSWDLETNTDDIRGDHEDWSGTVCPSFPCSISAPSDVPFVLDPLQFPISGHQLEFHTHVGAQLAVSGGAQVLTQAYRGAVSAWGEASIASQVTPAEGFEGLELTLGEVPGGGELPDDTTAPTVEVTLPEASPSGWHRDDVTVGLAASDTQSDVASISYRLGEGEPVVVEGDSAEVVLSAEGDNVLRYFATDTAGVSGEEEAVTVRIDTTAPVVQVPAPITVVGTSASGAAVPFTVTANDGGAPIPISCTPASGSVFPIGTTAVTCTATDMAGNPGTAGFSVTVTAPAAPGVQELGALSARVTALGHQGARQPLTNKLAVVSSELAEGDRRSACRQLDQFAAMVAQRTFRQIPLREAAALGADYLRARRAIGC